MEPGDLVPVHPPNDRERPPGISGDSVGRAKRLHNGYDSYELKGLFFDNYNNMGKFKHEQGPNQKFP